MTWEIIYYKINVANKIMKKNNELKPKTKRKPGAFVILISSMLQKYNVKSYKKEKTLNKEKISQVIPT